MVKRNLVFYFLCPNELNDLHKLHILMLGRYANLFDKASFYLAVDDLNNTKTAIEVEKLLVEQGYSNNTTFFITKNDPVLREGIVFKNEIANKLDSYDGITFFGHTHGTFRHKENFLSQIYWIMAMYYFCLGKINEAEEKLLNDDNCFSYGAFPFYSERFSSFEYPINKWWYHGTFFFLNTKKISDYINGRGISLSDFPEMQGYAESFCGNVFDWTHSASSMKWKLTYIHLENHLMETLKLLTDKKSVDEFNDFCKCFFNENNFIIENNVSLTDFANECQTDKGTNYMFKHDFSEFYEPYFKELKGKNPNILEIGIADGGSIDMYDKYFNGECNIYSIDIFDKSIYDKSNVKTFICDQSSEEELQMLKDKLSGIKFDFILDDGSHVLTHQLTSLKMLIDLVKPGGYYILEDLHTINNAAFYNGLDETESPLSFLTYKSINSYLGKEESDRINDKIEYSIIYSRPNKSNPDCNNKSITSLIKIKK